MTTLVLPRPSASRGPRPERRAADDTWPRRVALWASALQTHRQLVPLRSFTAHLDRIHAVEQRLENMNPGELNSFRRHLSRRLSVAGFTNALSEQVFALVRLTTSRILGKRLYDEQVYAGWLMHKGFLVEMATGEGKTLSALMPACAAGLASVPVHVISANDYLVRRDADELEPVYAALDLSIGCVAESDDDDARCSAYAADITYVSNKQLVFDYLRDRQGMGTAPGSLSERIAPLLNGGDSGPTPRLRGLCYAIIDEADSVLIDDARTPLILSEKRSAQGASRYAVALGIARQLQPYVDFLTDPMDETVRLTDAGFDAVLGHIARLEGIWSNPKFARELVHQALQGLHIFKRDEHYVVRDERVLLVDETTGRTMADRSLQHGLQQIIETLEGCAITEQARTLARISYQQFFGKYLKLAGMTGTAAEIVDEIRQTYRISVVRVPTHRPCQRVMGRLRVYADAEIRDQALIAEVRHTIEAGRPVLIGTRTVAASERCAEILSDAGLTCRVLNALQDQAEAEVVRCAGESRRITVATNMAGRGTDIPISPQISARGGLHVICTELNEAARIDRQLHGRAARQGDPGSCGTLLSLDDPLIVKQYRAWQLAQLRALACRDGYLWQWLAPHVVRRVQRAIERRHHRARHAVQKHNEQLRDLLAFTGTEET